MGTLFKRSDRGGRSGNWYAQFVDENGNRNPPKSTRTSDKSAAKQILAKWEADAALRRAGVIDIKAERLSYQSRRPIEEHYAEFRQSLESPGNSGKHVSETMKILTVVADLRNWQLLTDITIESARLLFQVMFQFRCNTCQTKIS